MEAGTRRGRRGAVIALLPALPLAGFVLCGIAHLAALRARKRRPGARVSEAVVGGIATALVAASFAVAAIATARIAGTGGAAVLETNLGNWIETGSLRVDATLRFDALSAALCLVVTGVGTLVHLYSIGYMRGDPAFARYFAFLNLFVAAMLLLVLAANLPLLFAGWEGVGLCSYLLIGFWYEKGFPAAAAVKAFVANRVGDAGFLIGIFFLAATAGTLDLGEVEGAAASGFLSREGASVAAALLFCGAVGKSAQIPLLVWLPDAMAGPTPVSALIHAATMVTAGVYLLARLDGLFLASPEVLLVVAGLGAATALYGAWRALGARDLKRALAYSTISQLGLMFVGSGAGAFDASIGHLITHAFFKALLFLAAGSVLHALSGEGDLSRMGGLRTRMPWTAMLFAIGAAALAGIPPLSGFLSKDALLGRALAAGGAAGWILAGAGYATSALTALYAFRLVHLVFGGKRRFEGVPHESPRSMLLPMGALAALAVFGGALIGVFGFAPLGDFLRPALAAAPPPHAPAKTEALLLASSAAVALLGAIFAGRIWGRRGPLADEAFARSVPGRVASGTEPLDLLVNRSVVRPLRATAIGCSVFDLFVLDGAVEGSAKGTARVAQSLRALQTGRVQHYALAMAGALAALLFLALLSRG